MFYPLGMSHISWSPPLPVTLALCTFTDPNASAVSGLSSDENFRPLTQVLRQNVRTIVGSQLHPDALLGWPVLPVPVLLCLLIASLVDFDYFRGSRW